MQLTFSRQLAIVVGGGVIALVVVLIGMLAGQTAAPHYVSVAPSPAAALSPSPIPPAPQDVTGITLPIPLGLALPIPSVPADELDTWMGSRWQPPQVTIDNQVGPAFTPLLNRAVAAWRQVGAPVNVITAYGGAPACDDATEPPMGTVVVCRHVTPTTTIYVNGTPQTVVDDGYTDLRGDESETLCDSPRCPAMAGIVWLAGTLHGARLYNVLLHELGHVLGLSYAPTSNDVMNEYAPVPTITARDVASLQWLYS